jgi:AcrR family transcriptional regulator
MPMRDHILDAAQQVLADKGQSSFTLVEVCRVAGLSHTSVYKHFESRDHIMQALTGRWLDGIMQQLQVLPDTGGARGDQLHRAFLSLLRQKSELVAEAPYLHAAYSAALEQNLDLKTGWTERLRGLVATIVAADDQPEPELILDGIMAATVAFRHPVFVSDASNANLEHGLAAVMLMMSGHVVMSRRSHAQNP